MSESYVGEIRMFAGSYAPQGWAFCDGSLVSIAENDVLFTLIGTTYGGDGVNTFGLPDLRGRVPIHQGAGPGLSTRTLGEAGGEETVTLTTPQIPAHNHAALANNASGNADTPANNFWAASATTTQYVPGDQANTAMGANAIVFAGGNQPHDNMLPFTTISFIISLYGIYPQQG
jgi:microcystin-dependent protein